MRQTPWRLRAPTSSLAFALSAIAVAALAPGCVVKDEMKDGLREMRSEIGEADLALAPDGTGSLHFRFNYGIALVDKLGVDGFPWEYRLVDRNRHVLATHSQDMRAAQPDKTQVLVTGERERRLDVPKGALVLGETYVLWVIVQYRGETVNEILSPVVAADPGALPVPDAGATEDAGAADPDAGILLGTSASTTDPDPTPKP